MIGLNCSVAQVMTLSVVLAICSVITHILWFRFRNDADDPVTGCEDFPAGLIAAPIIILYGILISIGVSKGAL